MTQGEAIAELRDGTPVGAWMLKARPDVWDIATAIEEGLSLDWWRLAPSYRAGLVQDGHPCALWITRGDSRVASGIWAVGHIAGQVYLDAGDPDDGLWIDREAQHQVRPRVPVSLEVCNEPLTREELRFDERLAGMEILRVPRIGNPAAITPSEWTALATLLDWALFE